MTEAAARKQALEYITKQQSVTEQVNLPNEAFSEKVYKKLKKVKRPEEMDRLPGQKLIDLAMNKYVVYSGALKSDTAKMDKAVAGLQEYSGADENEKVDSNEEKIVSSTNTVVVDKSQRIDISHTVQSYKVVVYADESNKGTNTSGAALEISNNSEVNYDNKSGFDTSNAVKDYESIDSEVYKNTKMNKSIEESKEVGYNPLLNTKMEAYASSNVKVGYLTDRKASSDLISNIKMSSETVSNGDYLSSVTILSTGVAGTNTTLNEFIEDNSGIGYTDKFDTEGSGTIRV